MTDLIISGILPIVFYVAYAVLRRRDPQARHKNLLHCFGIMAVATFGSFAIMFFKLIPLPVYSYAIIAAAAFLLFLGGMFLKALHKVALEVRGVSVMILLTGLIALFDHLLPGHMVVSILLGFVAVVAMIALSLWCLHSRPANR